MKETLRLYLSVPLQVLPDGHGLLDQVVQVLGQVWGQAFGLEDPQDLVTGDKTYLGNAVGVPQNHTCRGKQTPTFRNSTHHKRFICGQTKRKTTTTQQALGAGAASFVLCDLDEDKPCCVLPWQPGAGSTPPTSTSLIIQHVNTGKTKPMVQMWTPVTTLLLGYLQTPLFDFCFQFSCEGCL